MTRLWDWLAKRFIASEEDSRYYNHWDRIIDHEANCHCPYKGQVIADMLAICERHSGFYGTGHETCSRHAHTYEQVTQ
jgi:hypothetical protein